MAAGFASKGLDLAFALFYLRVLQPEGAAVFQWLVVFITYLDTLINFGLNTILAREVARSPHLSTAAFVNVSIVRLGLWLAGLPVMLVVLGPAREALNLSPEALPAGWLFYAALLPSALASTATGLLWAAERLHQSAIVAVLTTLVKIVAGVVLLLGGLGLVGLALSSLFAGFSSAVALLALAARAGLFGAAAYSRQERESMEPLVAYQRTSPLADASATLLSSPRALLRESWPLFLNQLLAGMFFKIDTLMLPALAGQRPAGIYAAAYKVVDGVGVISSSVTLAIFPRLARDASGDPRLLKRAYRLTLRSLLQVAFPLATGIALLSEPIIALIGGAEFLPEGALALAVLIWFMPFSFTNGLIQYVLIALGKQRVLTPIFAAAVTFNVVGNFLLIPLYGFLGAALVTVASELVLLGPFWWTVHRAIPGVSPPREAVHAILATLVMAPAVWWLNTAVHPLAAIPAGLLVYPLALWLLGGLDPDQRALLHRALQGVRRTRLHDRHI